MSASEDHDDSAFRIAARLRSRPGEQWDVYAESLRHYEVHLNGAHVELLRGPIRLVGYGLRLLRPVAGQMGVGFASATDPSDRGIDRTVADAEAAGRYARFPAKAVELPSGGGGAAPQVETVDRTLAERPEESLDAYVSELLAPFDGRSGVVPSFGSVRATLAEVTIANSEGAERRFARTMVDFEFAVKATGGPEGAPPGEYWVNRASVRLDPKGLADEVEGWCRKASDVRRAAPTPSGTLSVVFPATVLSDFLPEIVGYRLGGVAELRGMMPAPGTLVAPETLGITDDGLFPFGLGSSPWDDEGTPQLPRRLVTGGKVDEPLYDLLYASALGRRPTGSGRRDQSAFLPWFHFPIPPGPGTTTMVVAPGGGGSDEELAESVGEGIWVDQLGYAFPDPVSSAFGGEVRVGYRIRHGKLAEPVRGGTVGGLLFAEAGASSVLRSVSHIGSRPTLVGRLSAPAIAVRGLTVAGAG
jgi:predicted Zn-dependent protease